MRLLYLFLVQANLFFKMAIQEILLNLRIYQGWAVLKINDWLLTQLIKFSLVDTKKD